MRDSYQRGKALTWETLSTLDPKFRSRRHPCGSFPSFHSPRAPSRVKVFPVWLLGSPNLWPASLVPQYSLRQLSAPDSYGLLGVYRRVGRGRRGRTYFLTKHGKESGMEIRDRLICFTQRQSY